MNRILIAEDDHGIAEFIARGLESEGYSCDVADNGPVAFGMARSGAYQLMILDLGLPNMDGADVLEQLRTLGTSLPIIVLPPVLASKTASARLKAAPMITCPNHSNSLNC